MPDNELHSVVHGYSGANEKSAPPGQIGGGFGDPVAGSQRTCRLESLGTFSKGEIVLRASAQERSKWYIFFYFFGKFCRACFNTVGFVVKKNCNCCGFLTVENFYLDGCFY